MGCIEFLIVLTVATFYLSIMPGRKGADQLMSYPKLFQSQFKERLFFSSIGSKPVGKFAPVVCLNAFNCIRKALHDVSDKLCGKEGAVLFKCFQISKTAVFVDESVLVPLASFSFTNNTN